MIEHQPLRQFDLGRSRRILRGLHRRPAAAPLARGDDQRRREQHHHQTGHEHGPGSLERVRDARAARSVTAASCSGWSPASLVFGLASQDTAENAARRARLHRAAVQRPVHLGDTLYAYTEVLDCRPAAERDDAGIVRFQHWGVTHDERVVFEGERIVLVKRRSHWAKEDT